MDSSKRKVDHNDSVNSSFAFSFPFSSVGFENYLNVEEKVVTVDRKRKATWEAGGIAKKKRIHWDNQAKKQLFKTDDTNKKNNNSILKPIKQTKASRKEGKRTDDRYLFSINDIIGDQIEYIEFPSKSGNTHGKINVRESNNRDGPKYPLKGSNNTHGMIKVSASTKNNDPTKRDKNINWRVSILPFQLTEVLGNVEKSLTRHSNSQKDNMNNNDIPYLKISSSIGTD